MPTSGGVIGTWPKTLLDGSTLRLPRFSVYDVRGRNLERNPTKPEYVIDETFVHHMKDERIQLDRALELLKEEAERKAPVLVPDIKEEK
ncbi:MAG: hypothetical protein U5N86_03100 [Planctomycetota bacterium]|nr:hypothetical protein [Planctomycetota bacterium]